MAYSPDVPLSHHPPPFHNHHITLLLNRRRGTSLTTLTGGHRGEMRATSFSWVQPYILFIHSVLVQKERPDYIRS